MKDEQDSNVNIGPSGVGMTLRDWFAGQALAGRLARGDTDTPYGFAYNSYLFADAMIDKRGEEE